MGYAINFDDEFGAMAIKIRDKRANKMLTPKFQPAKAAAAKDAPKQ